MLGQRRRNGMNGLVSVDAFIHKTIEGPLHGNLVAERRLVFDDNVKGCVRRYIWQSITHMTMIVLNQTQTIILA
jgi:hypothetical protein